MVKGVVTLAVFMTLLLGAGVAQPLFSIDQMKFDLAFYKNKLEQYHPNLYLYTSKNSVDSYFDSLSATIKSPLSELEFYRIITLTSKVVKDGHTLILPSFATTEYHNTKNRFLPYQIGISGNNLYVKMNCTNEYKIPDGALIISINGVSGEKITQQLIERQVRDGNNLSYPYWIIDRYFREYYSFSYGHPQSYEIVYSDNNQTKHVNVNALPKDSIYYYRTQNYPSYSFENTVNSGLILQIDSISNFAILTIKDFHNEVLKREYKQNFKKTISTYFDEIIASGIENLILDLRNNQGGDVENGVLLLSHLLDKPFKVVNQYNCLKSKQLAKCKGPSMGKHKPSKKHFNGKLYVLMNGGSFSNSVIVAACLKTNNRAIFIGTETGGNPNILAGYAKDFELPNTKIYVEIPTKQFVMTSTNQNNGSGLIPDYIVHGNIPDKLQQIDTEINFIKALIKQNE
ncbi:MAG: hypothetical protein H6574_07670 [Lewinellaceae bacterium]|nr:hypothetical protein [Saprospiraceae bacterium]MCB9330942.1 hypothetical protein [Lewinellaceae bacterium]